MGGWGTWTALTVALVAAGCGPTGQLARAQQFGTATITLDRHDPRILTVTMLNTHDLGFDFNRAADRQAFISRMLAEQCLTPTIRETRVTQTGRLAFRDLQVFTITVDCPAGASQGVPG